jgi:hypothetical protein
VAVTTVGWQMLYRRHRKGCLLYVSDPLHALLCRFVEDITGVGDLSGDKTDLSCNVYAQVRRNTAQQPPKSSSSSACTLCCAAEVNAS